MIDVENELYTIVATAVREVYPDISMSGEYVMSPSSFPHISLVEMDNFAYDRTRTSESTENHASVLYEVNVYSNKTVGKKSECKKIIALIDKVLCNLGFTRTMLNPVPNMNDATVYRMTGRYKAVISKDNIIYRR